MGVSTGGQYGVLTQTHRISTVYQPYIYRISTVIDSREATQKCVETREGEFLVHFLGIKKTYKVDI